MSATIHHGDCLDVLRGMPDNSVDAICCDPPYGLSNTSPDKVTETIVRWAQGDREYVPQGRGFMGASWDAFVPPVAVWDECIRVLKPGGHLVAFAGSRTQDLMGLAIRLAGFDIRENLAWLYGSGFPKSMDISKAIDKANGRKFEDRYALGRHIREQRVALGLTPADVNAWFGYKDGCQHWERQDPSGARVPTLADWAILKPRLGLSDEHLAIVERVEAEREIVGIRSVPKGHAFAGSAYGGDSSNRDYNDTVASTPEAERWQGWGTALKPAHEPIILARKPFPGTVAQNTLTWGTGGLNIDATRIGIDPTERDVVDRRSGSNTKAEGWGFQPTGETFKSHAAGRWPANVVLDPDTAKALDQQSGTSKPKPERTGRKGGSNPNPMSWDEKHAEQTGTWPADPGGGASRFFKVCEPDEHGAVSPFFPREFDEHVVEPAPPFMYAAKAPKRERPSYTTEDGQAVHHATVKPLSIMQWLVKLVTPEGGTVLDPFAGSGTTVEAAILEGFNVIGIEREAEYLPLIQQRIDRANNTLPMAS